MMANNVHMQMSPAKENYSRRYIGKTLKALKGQFLIKSLRSFFAAGTIYQTRINYVRDTKYYSLSTTNYTRVQNIILDER